MTRSRRAGRCAAAAVATLALTAALVACDDPEEGAEPTPTLPASSAASEDPSEVADVSEDPSPSVDPQLACLAEGSTWHVVIPDMESQFDQALAGLDIIDVTITGGQTLSVAADGTATFTPNRQTVVRVRLDHGLTMVLIQRQRGSATGRWQLNEGSVLTAPEPWTGDLQARTTVTINGREAEQSIDLPVASLGDVPVTFSCAPRELMMHADGSPFSLLFR